MLNIDVTPSLCSACVYGDECVMQAEAGRVILQCGQFEMAFRAETTRRPPTQYRVLRGSAADESKYAGLCANCGNRETCTYTKPEGGVWRCDEYV